MFGSLVLTPSVASIPVARLPIALRAAPPEIDVAPAALQATVAPGSAVSLPLAISNVGNLSIDWDIDSSGSAPLALQTQLFDGQLGNLSDFFSGSNGGYFLSEDLVSDDAATLRTVEVQGFLLGTGGTLQATATAVTVKVYADNAGVPAGPEDPFSDIRTELNVVDWFVPAGILSVHMQPHQNLDIMIGARISDAIGGATDASGTLAR